MGTGLHSLRFRQLNQHDRTNARIPSNTTVASTTKESYIDGAYRHPPESPGVLDYTASIVEGGFVVIL
jgi:hypothetical protein